MRIRDIKPEFFHHEELAELPPLVRLFFIGLWCVADREGRFSWRPRRIKVEVLPYETTFDPDEALATLEGGGFIRSYEVTGRRYGMVTNWLRHQLPRRDEAPSELPAPNGQVTQHERPPNATIRARLYARDRYTCLYCQRDMTRDARARCLDHVVPYCKGGSNSERNLVTACKQCNSKKKDRTPTEAGLPWPAGFGDGDSLFDLDPVNTPVNPPLTVGQQITDMGIGEMGIGEREVPITPGESQTDSAQERWDRFWASYPRKVAKDAALREFLKIAPDNDLTDEMVAAVERHKASPQWQRDGGQYIPHPRTWLHQGRWKDEDDRRGPPPPPDPPPRIDWFAECQRLHGGKCNGWNGHRVQMQLDAAKASKAEGVA